MPSLPFDTSVPLPLKRTQQWFGKIISTPLDEEGYIQQITPSGEPIEKEASLLIAPSLQLTSGKRIEIYNQQYWYRLINVLQEAYPLLVRLFGYVDFNETIAVPYLTKYPPNTWTLNALGDRLTQWIEEEYHAPDCHLVLDAARTDHAYDVSFLAGACEPVHPALEQTITLQPFVRLLELSRDLPSVRYTFLKQEVDYWLEHDFPETLRDGPYYFAIYRRADLSIAYRQIHKAQHAMLCHIEKGASLEEVCDQVSDEDQEIVEAHLTEWIQEWLNDQWLISTSC